MLSAARLRRPQRLVALAWLLLALLMQALWMPRLAAAQAAGVEVCSAQGHRRIPLTVENGHPQHQHGLECCCPAAWTTAPPPAVAALLIDAGLQAINTAPRGAAPSPEIHAPLSRGPPVFLH